MKKEYKYGKYIRLEIYEDHAILIDNRANETKKYESIGKAFKNAKHLREFYNQYPNPIFITCSECGEESDELQVEILDISESGTLMGANGIGADIVDFVCPKCGKETKSFRRG